MTRRTDAHRLLCLVAALSITLVRLPVLVGGGFARYLALAPFVIAIGWLAARSAGSRSHATVLLLGGYVAVTWIGIARATAQHVYGTEQQAFTDAVTIGVVAGLGVMLMARASCERERRDLLIAVCLSPGVYVAANVLMLTAGLSSGAGASVAGTQSDLLHLVGISGTRVAFPLSSGVNSFGAVAASGLAASALLMMRVPQFPRWAAGISALVCLYGCVASDSRGALLVAVAVIASFSIGRRFLGAGLTALVPLSPFLVIGAVGLLANTGIVSVLSRSNQDILTATNRLYIWKPVIAFLEHPTLQQAVGYGANGQIRSGVLGSYAYLFSSNPDLDPTTHNIVLQSILDYGYLGLFIFGALVAVTIVRLWRMSRNYPSSPFPAVLAMFTVIMLSGMTEALPSYTFLDTLVPALLVMGIACTEWAVPPPRIVPADRATSARRVPIRA